jgi:Transposase protein
LLWPPYLLLHFIIIAILLQICHVHFKEEDIRRAIHRYDAAGNKITLKLNRVALKSDAIPCVFPNCPSYLSKSVKSDSVIREDVEDKKSRLENAHIRKAISESEKTKLEYDDLFAFTSLDEFYCKVNNSVSLKLDGDWKLFRLSNHVTFVLMEIADPSGHPKVSASMTLNSNLELRLCRNEVPLKKLSSFIFPMKVSNIHIVIEIFNTFKLSLQNVSEDNSKNLLDVIPEMLDSIKLKSEESQQKKLSFLSEQFKLLNCSKHHNTYSMEFLIFFSILHSISSHAYRYFRSLKLITMPHPTTLKKICGSSDFSPRLEQSDDFFLLYAKQKFRLLNDSEHIINLQVDEIHLKQFLDFKGGDVVGFDDKYKHVATSAHVFLINSLRSPYKDVVHILPVRKINAFELYSIIVKIITGLHNIGFKVVSIVTDNNAINRSAIKFFSPDQKTLNVRLKNPAADAPLFYVIDPVHILKCIRNNWLNQKDPDQTIVYPNFDNPSEATCIAKFSSIKKLYNVERNNLVRFANTLNAKSLFPSPIERQNVKLALNIFNEHVVQGLTKLGHSDNIPHFDSTAAFINIIINWWNIINVKFLNKDVRFKNELMKPLSVGEKGYEYLKQSVAWLHHWESLNCSSGKLTKETHLALCHTSQALTELASYCIEELGFKYLLTGKIQTDNLEARFGSYRTMAGSQYLISIRQVFEIESKIRMQNTLPLILKSKEYGNIIISQLTFKSFFTNLNIEQSGEQFDISDFEFEFTEDNFNDVNKSLPVLCYIAGYCARSVINHFKCDNCKSYLVLDKELNLNSDPAYDHIKAIDRGSLLYPSEDLINAILINYLVVLKLCNSEYEVKFLKCNNQRQTVMSLSEKVIKDYDFFLTDLNCPIHKVNSILKHILKTSSNIFLNNYVKKVNDTLNKTKIDYLSKRKVAKFGH